MAVYQPLWHGNVVIEQQPRQNKFNLVGGKKSAWAGVAAIAEAHVRAGNGNELVLLPRDVGLGVVACAESVKAVCIKLLSRALVSGRPSNMALAQTSGFGKMAGSMAMEPWATSMMVSAGISVPSDSTRRFRA